MKKFFLIFLAVVMIPSASYAARDVPDEEFRYGKTECEQKGGVFGREAWDKPLRCFMPADPLYEQISCGAKGHVLLEAEEYGAAPACITKEECAKRGGMIATNKTTLLEYCFVSPQTSQKRSPETGGLLRQKLVDVLPREFAFLNFYIYLQRDNPEFQCWLTKDGQVQITNGDEQSAREIRDLGYGGYWEVRYKILMVHYTMPLGRELTGQMSAVAKIKLGITEDGRLTFDGQAVDQGPLMEGALRERGDWKR